MAPNAAPVKSSKPPKPEQPKKGLHQSSHNPLNEVSITSEANSASTIHHVPRPTHFLVRPRLSPDAPAIMVPLVPVDLLPHYIELAGVPRHLGAAQATGMRSVGTYEKPSSLACYRLRILPAGGGKDQQAPLICLGANGTELEEVTSSSCSSGSNADGEGSTSTVLSQPEPWSDMDLPSLKADKAEGKAIAQGSPGSPGSPGNSPSAVDRILASASAASAHHLVPSKKAKKDKHLHQHQHQPAKTGTPDTKPAPLSSSSSSNTPTTAAAAVDHPPAKGNFCRHFCLHGNCKWGHGCRYQHTMPMTVEGLREVGLRDWPPWYRTAIRMALDGHLATQQSGVVGMAFGPGHQHQHHMHPFQQGIPQGMAQGMGPMGMNMGMLDMRAMHPFAGLPGPQGLPQLSQGHGLPHGKAAAPSPAERKRKEKEREERQVRRAEEKMRALEAERAEGERMERVRAARAMKLSAAHAAAVKAALGDGEEMKLVDV